MYLLFAMQDAEPIRIFIDVLVSCQNEEESIKMKQTECLKHFPIIKDVQGQLTLHGVV